MSNRKISHKVQSQDRWTRQIAVLKGEQAVPARRKEPITPERIVQISLRIVEAEGFDALTMRRVAAALETGPASLYAHMRDKADLDDLLIGELCKRVVLPIANSVKWKAQFKNVCAQLRDQYLRYPGISKVVFDAAPRNLDTLRISEGLLAILLAAGIPTQRAVWALDAALLYVGGYALEASLRERHRVNADALSSGRDVMTEKLKMLPKSHFPNMAAHIKELTSGEGHDRFDFTLDLLIRGLLPVVTRARRDRSNT